MTTQEKIKPYKRDVARPVEKIIQQAHHKEIDTGKRRLIESVDAQGNVTQQEVPIKNKVFIEAVKEKVMVKSTIFCYNDGTDEHQFATQEELYAFLKSIGGK